MKKRPRHFGKIAPGHHGGRLVIETNLGFTEIYFVVDLLLVQADLNQEQLIKPEVKPMEVEMLSP